MDDRDISDPLLREVAAAPPIALTAEVSALLIRPGDIVDGTFEIHERLGAGGMGVVYAARDLTLGREVALKFMRFDRAATEAGSRLTEAFEREARATARLNHPNVVTLYQIGRWKGGIYLVLERLRGETLAVRLERGLMTAPEATAVGLQILAALVHVHGVGITHRDLKPQNIFLVDGDRVKVLDFGVSGLVRAVEATRPPQEDRRSTLAHAGTPGYMAPEQWRGERVDARADVWAVGAIMFQLVVGKLPFGSGSLARDEPAPAVAVRAVDPVLADIIGRCLAPRPADRPSAADVVVALRQLRPETPALARAHVRVRPRRILAGVVLAGTVIAMAAAVLREPAECPVDGRARRVWNADTKAVLARHLKVDESEIVRAAFVQAARDLDTYVTEWESLARRGCQHAATRGCLADRYATLARTVDLLAMLTPASAQSAVSFAAQLPPVRDCADPDVAQAVVDSAAVQRDAGPPFRSVMRISSHAQDNIHDILELPDGDVVVAAYASATLRLLGHHVVDHPANDRSGVLARMRGDALVWSLEPEARMLAIERLPSGDLAMAGVLFNASPFAGGTSLDRSHGWNCFVAVVDAERGVVRWADRCHATGSSSAMSLAVDDAGNLYVGGQFGGTMDLGGRRLDATTNRKGVPFVASWAHDGALRWITAGTEVADTRTHALAFADGALVVGSTIYGRGFFAGRRLTGGCMLARLDPERGDVLWLTETNGAAAQCSVEDVIMRDHRLFAAGSIDDVGWIGEISVEDGSARWRRTVGASNTRVRALGSFRDGTLLAGGYFGGERLDLDVVHLANFGERDAFVVAVDREGRGLRGLRFGGTSADVVRSLHVGPTDRVWVGGRFQTGMTLGKRELRSSLFADAYLIELSPELR